MKTINLYCDGSSLGNPGYGGWCAILQYKDSKKIISGSEEHATNNRMELTSVIEALKQLKSPCNINLYSDSKYVCDGINQWLNNWINKNFKNVKNVDLWKTYINLSKKHKIIANWIKGHNGHIENEQCDEIARMEAQNLKNINNNLQYHDNASNKNDTQIIELEKKINYAFKNKNLLLEALTHKSYNKNANNERLEFLGDAVLDLVIGEYLFKKLNSSSEGKLTKIRASIVNEKGFTKLAILINLGEYLFISLSEEKGNGRKKPSILSNAFEALFGAIYLDSNLNEVKRIIYKLIEDMYKDIDLETISKDYKTILQELTQSIFGIIPVYQLIEENGPDHNKEFLMSLHINEIEYARAKGKTKKEAEQNCAKSAYNKIKIKK